MELSRAGNVCVYPEYTYRMSFTNTAHLVPLRDSRLVAQSVEVVTHHRQHACATLRRTVQYRGIMSVQSQTHRPSALDLRRDLGNRLRVIRLRANLSGKDLAALLGCHPSKISRIEHATAIPSIADIRAWCVHCQAEDQTEELEAAAVAVEAAFASWRSEQRAGFVRMQENTGNLFEGTRRFAAYESHVVPGLLQTEAYAAAILSKLQAWRGSPDDVSDAAASRFELRRLLSGPATFNFLIEEYVLRSPIVTADVMHAQLEQLLEDSQRPAVSLGIIPLDVTREQWPVESHYIYDEQVVRVQLVPGRFTLNAPGDIADYLTVFRELSSLAVVGNQARDLIRRAMR